MHRIGGGCNAPVAVHAIYDDGKVKIDGLLAARDGSRVIRDSVTGDYDTAEEAATALADRILAQGVRGRLESLL